MAIEALGRDIAILEGTPTVDTSAYASGDLIGDDKITLGDAVISRGYGGLIESVVITDLGKQSASIDVVFFTSDPSGTTFTDNAALDIADTDLVKIVGVAAVADWYAFNDNSVGQVLNLALPFVLRDDENLYAALVSRGTPTYASTSDLTLRVGVLRNPAS